MNIRTIVIALIGLVCGGATTLAVTLPAGAMQRGAADVAAVCQASGFTGVSAPGPSLHIEPNPGTVPPGPAPTQPMSVDTGGVLTEPAAPLTVPLVIRASSAAQ